MIFCTDCGKELPDNAVFCPNCGHRSSSAPSTPADSNQESCDAQQQFTHDAQSPDTQESREQYTDNNTNNNAYDARPQANSNSAYSLDPSIYKSSLPTANTGSSNSKTAVIVICSVLALMIIAAVLIMLLPGNNSEYIGYWESTDVDLGDDFSLPDMYGEDVRSLIVLQIEKDHSIYLASSFEEDIMSGIWKKSSKGLEAEINDEEMHFFYNEKNDTLTLSSDEGFRIVFERAEGNIHSSDEINDPSSALGGNGEKSNEVSGSGSVGNDSFYISVVGAEHFSDIDEKDAMRIYFEFTNNSSHSTSAWSSLEYYARQDGKKLEETYTWDDVDVYGNANRNIRPGVKIQCCYEFKYDYQGGSVDFLLSDYNLGADGGTITATFNPGELPGRTSTFSIDTIDNPKWTVSLPGEGYLDDDYYVAVTDAELVEDYYGDSAIRVYYEFTNNSNYETSLGDSLYSFTYQDGISLDGTYTAVYSETDENYYEMVSPGGTIRASCVFLLRNNNSPVEAEIEASNTYDAVGQTYTLS